ncbi:MAG: hypothetical protein WDM79_15635 [Terricaulis sp.]
MEESVHEDLFDARAYGAMCGAALLTFGVAQAGDREAARPEPQFTVLEPNSRIAFSSQVNGFEIVDDRDHPAPRRRQSALPSGTQRTVRPSRALRAPDRDRAERAWHRPLLPISWLTGAAAASAR